MRGGGRLGVVTCRAWGVLTLLLMHAELQTVLSTKVLDTVCECGYSLIVVPAYLRCLGAFRPALYA